MKRLLGNIVQAVIISTIAIVAVLNSSVQDSKNNQVASSIPHVTVVTEE